MDLKRWQRVEEIFRRAVELPREAQPDFLRQACGGDPDLHTEVEELLLADHEAGRTIESAIADGTGLLDQARARAGRLIGRYELLRELGQGGMGTVYLARRADREFERQVALKLIQPGLGSHDIVRRFRRERQILAGLEHPSIAKLLDGGTTEEGLPYLVMEYVEGLPIDRYCDQQGLDLGERLGLFRKVCAAVAHAHQNLVIHRDLKPGNILVREIAGPSLGEVKLLDFGIAKLLGPEPSGTTGIAATTVLATTRPLMTPAYASPEQVRGELVGTASDVYSLGVILYQLLAGRRPYDLTGHSAADIERVVCEEDPRPPSEARRRAAEESGPASGSDTGDSLARRLRGDLDRIVLMALSKERSRRYGSVEQLYEDIGRYLAGQPVVARKSTFTYRASKFIRRNRWPLAAAFVFVALLVGFAVSMALQSRRIARERDKAERVVDFVVDLSISARADLLGRSTSTTARREFDARAEDIVRDLSSQPRVQTRLLDAMGRVYHELSFLDRSQEVLRRSLEIRRRSGEDREIAESLSHLADLLTTLSRVDEAEPMLREALELERQIHRGDHLDVARGLQNLAKVLLERGDFEGARTHYQESLDMKQRLFGEDHPEVAESLNDLGLVLQSLGQVDAAEAMLRRAFELYRRILGDEDRDVAMVSGNLGQLLRDRGELEKAEPLLRRALDLDRRIFGEEHGKVAIDLDDLGLLLQDQGKFDDAEQSYRRALAIRRTLLDPDHPEISRNLNNLATLEYVRGEYGTAETLFREALERLRRHYGEAHPDVAAALNNLAVVLQAQGRHGDAAPLLEETLALRRSLLGDDHHLVAQSIENLGALYFEHGDHEAAEARYREALETHRRTHGGGHPTVAFSMDRLGRLLWEEEDHVAAERFFRQALEILRQALGDPHPEVAKVLAHLAGLTGDMGDRTTAEKLFRQAVEQQRELLDPGHPDLADSLLGLGRLLLEAGDPRAAEPLLREGLDFRIARSPDHWRTAEARSLWGACLAGLNRPTEAEGFLLRAYERLRGTTRRKQVQEARSRLVAFYQARGRADAANRYR